MKTHELIPPNPLEKYLRRYEVEDNGGDTVTVVAFKNLRGYGRTRESQAAKVAANKPGRKWKTSETTSTVNVEVPRGQLGAMKQSLGSKGFSEGQRPGQ